MAGGSANRSIEQLINFGGYRQFSVPKPPLLLLQTVMRNIERPNNNKQ